MSRSARVERSTKESSVLVELDLDGTGVNTIDTGVPFFDHMLAQLSKHGGIDLVVRTTGDLEVDAHAAFRHWRAVQQGRRGMDQAGTWCQGFGSGYWWCVDMPVNGDPPQPVRAVVVAGATVVTVTPR